MFFVSFVFAEPVPTGNQRYMQFAEAPLAAVLIQGRKLNNNVDEGADYYTTYRPERGGSGRRLPSYGTGWKAFVSLSFAQFLHKFALC